MSVFNRDTDSTTPVNYTLGKRTYRSNTEVELINVLHDANGNPCTAIYAEIILGNKQKERTAVITQNKLGYKFNFAGIAFYLKEFN